MRRLVLGGGSCQLNLIKRAKERGDFVIVADYLPDCPGAALADAHVQVSTFDYEGVLRAAKEYRAQGVVTMGTDQPVLTAAMVADKLGFPFYISPDTARTVTNKRMMKQLFRAYNIPCVASVLVGEGFRESDIHGLRFPAVLKPVDSQGQRGIFLVDDALEAQRRVCDTLDFSREDHVLLEEFYKNDELTVNGWVENGNTTVLSVVDRVTMKNTKHIGVCLCHNYPSLHYGAHHAEILALTERIVSAFQIKDGPIYFQYLRGAEGLKVNEIAARIGGAYEDITLPWISGVDILEMLLDYTEYGRCDTRALISHRAIGAGYCLSTQLFFFRPGFIRTLTPVEEMLTLSGVRAMHYNVREGDEIPPVENATARAGYLMVEGDSIPAMINHVNAAFDRLHALDAEGNDIVLRYCDYKEKYLFAKETGTGLE